MMHFAIVGLFVFFINAVPLHCYRWCHGSAALHTFKKLSSVNKQQSYGKSTKLYLSSISHLKSTDIHKTDPRFVKPRVERLVEDADRVPVKDLKVGEKLRGRIISIVE